MFSSATLYFGAFCRGALLMIILQRSDMIYGRVLARARYARQQQDYASAPCHAALCAAP